MKRAPFRDPLTNPFGISADAPDFMDQLMRAIESHERRGTIDPTRAIAWLANWNLRQEDPAEFTADLAAILA